MNQPSPFPPLVPGTIHVWLVDIEETPQELHDHEALLTDEELERANRFRFDRDRIRFIVRRAGLRRLLSLYTGVEAGRVEYQVNKFGKLSLSSGEVRFSMAHSQDRVAYTFSTECDVGVDIEWVKPLQDPEKLARHLFSISESAELSSLEPSLKLDGFYHIWTQKEAFVKARGEGLSYPLQNFSVSADPDSPGSLLSIENEDALAWRMLTVAPEPGLWAAICVRSRIVPIMELIKITLLDFSARFFGSDSKNDSWNVSLFF